MIDAAAYGPDVNEFRPERFMEATDDGGYLDHAAFGLGERIHTPIGDKAAC